MKRFLFYLLLACAVTFVMTAGSSDQSAFVGIWKFNADKSAFGNESPKILFSTVRIEASGKGLKSTTEAADGEGRADQHMFDSALDGSATRVVGSPIIDSLTLVLIDSHTIRATASKDGKTAYTDRRVVSPDGGTLTVTRTGTTPEGKNYQSTLVFDKLRK